MLPRNAWGDSEFCRRRFVRRQGRQPDLTGPGRFTDRLYRIKVDGLMSEPLYQSVTDKEFAKQYIADAVGWDYVLATYRILRNRNDIETFVPDRLPCVLKPTHLSGPVLFHTDPGKAIDRDQLYAWIKRERYSSTREANYRGLRPKVIVEEFFSEDGMTVPKDYKLFCFHGVPKMIQVDAERFRQHTRNFYDERWIRLPVSYLYPNGPDDEKPPALEEMLDVASRLASPFPFVRVGLYASPTRVCAGELTFCPEGANAPLFPSAADTELGKLFDPDYRLDARACAAAWARD
ncbi:MAG: ATP-grasp fold amidoligase family protein [Boseongicola sp.]|nr:ATP-grasp fold amidoligase family protein [Boseongicola sp.]